MPSPSGHVYTTAPAFMAQETVKKMCRKAAWSKTKGSLHCVYCEVSTREDCSDMSLSQWKVCVTWSVITLGIWDPSGSLSISQDELRRTKPTSWVDLFQLTRAVSQNQTYRNQKAKVVHLKTFPELRTLKFVCLFVCLFCQVVLMCQVLQLEQAFHHGVNCGLFN